MYPKTADQNEGREAHILVAYEALRGEFIHTLFHDPDAAIETPAFRDERQRLTEVVFDLLAGDDNLLRMILGIVGECAQGQDPATHHPANAVVLALAHMYAEDHADAQALREAANA